MFWPYVKMAMIPLPLPEHEKTFFLNLHCESLVGLLEVNSQKGGSHPVSDPQLEFLTVRFVCTELQQLVHYSLAVLLQRFP